jgi:hypothetical protein
MANETRANSRVINDPCPYRLTERPRGLATGIALVCTVAHCSMRKALTKLCEHGVRVFIDVAFVNRCRRFCPTHSPNIGSKRRGTHCGQCVKGRRDQQSRGPRGHASGEAMSGRSLR